MVVAEKRLEDKCLEITREFQAIGINLFQNLDKDFWTLSPREQLRTKVYDKLMYSSLFLPIKLLSQQIHDFVIQNFLEADSAGRNMDSLKNPLGMSFAPVMCACILNNFKKEDIEFVVSGFMSGMYLNGIEKMTDDKERLVIEQFLNGNINFLFPESDVAVDFKTLAVQLIDEEIDLEDGIQKIKALDFGDNGGEISDAFKVILSNLKSNDLDDETVGFVKNLSASLVSLNLIGVYFALLSVDSGSNIVRDFARQSLRNRYESGIQILRNPSMEIEEALIWGQKSILTDFTFSSTIQQYLKARPDLIKAVEKNWSLIKETIENASVVIRLLNDVGPVLLESNRKGVGDLLNEVSVEYDKSYPSLFFCRFRDSNETLSIRLKNALDRQIRDSGSEYNMILNSGFRSDLSVDEAWELYFFNLEKAQDSYRQSKEVVERNLVEIKRVLGVVEVSNVIGKFLEYNYELYGHQGDYDVTMAEGLLDDLRTLN